MGINQDYYQKLVTYSLSQKLTYTKFDSVTFIDNLLTNKQTRRKKLNLHSGYVSV